MSLRRSSRILVVLLVACVSPGASAASIPPWEGARAAALGRLEMAAGLLHVHRLAEAVATVASLDDIHADVPPFWAADLDVPLPPAILDPVSRLLGAVRRAEAIARDSVRLDAAEFGAARREATRVMSAWTRNPSVEPAGLEDLRRLVRARVDTGGLVAASMTVARAIDDALPALRAAARGPSSPSGAVLGCDVADVPGVLCIGGPGDNTYDRDAALVVDLGGNDMHTNSAGGADPLVNGLAVAVTIDVAGRDTYRRGAAESMVAQGAGETGGVGFLVDVAGDDVYEFEQTAPNARANGQGYGVAGAGVLADLGGSDRYSIRNTGYGIQQVNGLGTAGLGGVALALDAGGDDTYAIASLPTPLQAGDRVELGEAGAYGFGVGQVGGVAVFADAGGTDAMTVEAIVPAPPAGLAQAGTRSSSSLAFGQGGAAVGIAVSGPGDTTWSARIENNSQPSGDFGGSASLGGSGQGALGGFGGLYDTGGNDSYVSIASARAVRERSVEDSCECPDAALVARSGFAGILATGYGAAGGTGILLDAGGDDRYVDVAESIARATAHDARSSPPSGGTVRAEAASSDADLYVQGAGLVGFGYLLDLSGADAYEATATSEARATATAASAGMPTEAVANGGRADTTFAQAAGQLGGYGELFDGGGVDRYAGRSSSVAEANPPTGGASGLAVTSVQGSVDLGGFARFSDLDGGADDVIESSPPDVACFGARGQGLWGDCGIGVGVGANA